jgi:hypothetical protein
VQASAEATTKVPVLWAERARIDAELRRRNDEARRLMDALAAGDVSGQLVRDRVTELGDEIGRLERRIADTDAEIQRLDASVVTPKQVTATLTGC